MINQQGENAINQLKVVGKPIDRIDGPLKTTGRATYAYEHQIANIKPAYGYIVGAGIAKERIEAIHQTAAKSLPGVIGVITASNAGPLKTGKFYADRLLAGPDVLVNLAW
ncbi:hypothetical protein ASE92_07605 [Pedobacter sp. Leaf41]|uniref:hypothetical protein n=1 Tax=Pedobacter sp. Leaf41 TaxID=1736218 RepID=UPI000702AC91|nr:hypothetical protein [Pedobacter sp. Leaf41]KQN35995.1 hypothetical protein ASE92_07605 [Pedobacter sp. Leaf41]